MTPEEFRASILPDALIMRIAQMPTGTRFGIIEFEHPDGVVRIALTPAQMRQTLELLAEAFTVITTPSISSQN